MTPTQEFFQAIEQGNIDLVRTLLVSEPVDVNTTNQNGQRAIIVAAKAEHIEIVKLLMKQATIDRDHASKFDEITLKFFQAAEQGNIDLVRDLLVDKQTDVNVTDKNGFTALFGAAHAGRLAMVKLLLVKGIDVDHISNAGETALLWVIVRGGANQLATVKLLLDGGAKKHLGEVLVWAATKGYGRLVQDLLTQHKVDNRFRYTALRVAADAGQLSIVALLLERKGIDIDHTPDNNRGRIALSDTVYGDGANQLATVDRLLKKYLFKALVWAAKEGHENVVRDLLDNHKLNVNEADDDGYTVLFTAARAGRLAMVKLLLERGVDIDHRAKKGETALYWAIIGGDANQLPIIEHLLAWGAKKNLGEVLRWAAKEGYERLVRDLLDNHKVAVNATDKVGCTALFLAAKNNHEACIKVLLKADADLFRTIGGQTPFKILPPRLREKAALLKIRNDYQLDSLRVERASNFKLPQEIMDRIILSIIQNIMAEDPYKLTLTIEAIQELKLAAKASAKNKETQPLSLRSEEETHCTTVSWNKKR